MRKFLLIAVLILPLAAEHVHWLGDYKKAHQKALREEKMLLVLVAEPNSPKTASLLKTVFMDRPYIDKINKRVVAVIVYSGSQSSYPVEMYYTRAFPTLFFVDPRQELFLAPPLYAQAICPERLSIMFSKSSK